MLKVCGIIGYGKMGKIYERCIKSLGWKAIICDVQKDEKKEILSFPEFLKREMDFVIVSTPTTTHYYITKELIINRFNCLVEKPVCLSVKELKDLLKFAQRYNVKLRQSSIERYNNKVNILKEKIRSARFIVFERGSLGNKEDYFSKVWDLEIHNYDILSYAGIKDKKTEMKTYYGKRLRNIILDGIKYSLEPTNNPILEQIKDFPLNRLSQEGMLWLINQCESVSKNIN